MGFNAATPPNSHHLLAALLGITASVGCARVTLPPLAPRDPTEHSLYLVAFAAEGEGYLVVEQRDGGGGHLFRVDPVAGTREVVEIEATLAGAGDRAQRLAPLHAQPLAAYLAANDYRWAEAQPGGEVRARGAALRLQGDAVSLIDETLEIALFELASSDYGEITWLGDGQGRRFALELVYEGAPRVRTLRLIDFAQLLAEKRSAHAYEHHLAGAYAVAQRWWYRALAAEPGKDSTRANILYNLACAQSRLGEIAAALDHLRAALALQVDPYRGHAQSDPDLAALQALPAFQALLKGDGEDAAVH